MGEAPFKCRHRKADRDFSHGRRLLFSRVVMMILRKSVKPLQSMVNEAMEAAEASPVDGVNYPKAEYQLNETQHVHNPVGFVKDGTYYVLPAQVKELAPHSSYDPKAILKVLKERGGVVGDTSKQLRVPTFETQIKVWEVSGSVLNAE
jgi:alkylated DNA repair dioxygenase AlkB